MSFSSDIDAAVETLSPTLADTPAPSSTPSAAPSAASTAPASAVAAGPAAQSPPPPTPPAATAPGSEDDEYADVPVNGSIPLARAQKALQNARQKEAARLASEYGISVEDWKAGNWNQHVQTLQSNPVEFHRLLTQSLRQNGLLPADPTPAPAVPAKTPPTAPQGMPKPSLQAEDGRPAYTAEEAQALVDFKLKELEARLTGQIQPLAQSYEQQQAQSSARQAVDEVKTYPHFEALKPQIVRLMQADGRVTLQSAYARALRDYVPTLEKSIRASVITDMQKAPVATPALAPSTVARVRPTVNGRQTFDQRLDEALATAFAPR